MVGCVCDIYTVVCIQYICDVSYVSHMYCDLRMSYSGASYLCGTCGVVSVCDICNVMYLCDVCNVCVWYA